MGITWERNGPNNGLSAAACLHVLFRPSFSINQATKALDYWKRQQFGATERVIVVQWNDIAYR